MHAKKLPLAVIVCQKLPLEEVIHLKTDFYAFSNHICISNDTKKMFKNSLGKTTLSCNNIL